MAGVIKKRINRSRTNQVVAPVQMNVELEPAQVFEVADKVIKAWVPDTGLAAGWHDTAYYYGMKVNPEDWAWIVCFPVVKVKTKPVQWHWISRLEVMPTDDDRYVVTLQLAHWRTRENAVIQEGAFVSFRDRFFETLERLDPSSWWLDSSES